MKLGKLARNLLSNSAPTLLAALALPPPFNVIASGVVSSALEKYAPAPKTVDDSGIKPELDPTTLEGIIEQNSEVPDFAVALRQAEIELQRYEIETGLRFQEIELEDRKRASELHVSAGIGDQAFDAGMKLVYIALGGLLILTIGLLLIIGGLWSPPVDQTDLTIAAFGVIGTAVGFVNGLANNVVSFYWGSSQGSKDKSKEMSSNLRELGSQLTKASAQAEAQRVRLAPPASASPTPSIQPRAQLISPAQTNATSEAATPAGFGIEDVLPLLTEPHSHFPESVSWRLVEDGIAVEGAPAARTNGEPKTIKRIWEQFGSHCQDWARSYRVPVELIVATIATETNGKRDARRFEPHLNEESVGLMQTLVSTANFALGRDSIKGDDLLDPSLSIEAGTAYIAMQRNETSFDPPLVAAAYNAGSIRKEAAQANRWRLVCFPKNTGRHVTKFVEWFGDAMRVSA
ncbi:lytic transglycosylase domain-containing protein, partial [Sedimentitalea todarodis]